MSMLEINNIGRATFALLTTIATIAATRLYIDKVYLRARQQAGTLYLTEQKTLQRMKYLHGTRILQLTRPTYRASTVLATQARVIDYLDSLQSQILAQKLLLIRPHSLVILSSTLARQSVLTTYSLQIVDTWTTLRRLQRSLETQMIMRRLVIRHPICELLNMTQQHAMAQLVLL